jgi:transposase-like protein
MSQSKTKRQFSDEVKRQAVDDYVSGRKSAAQIAAELNIVQNMIYRWRKQLQAEDRGERIEALESQGMDQRAARRLLELEEELELYQKKVAEQALQIDLLKKLRGLGTCLPESELTGLINTIKASARKRKPVK